MKKSYKKAVVLALIFAMAFTAVGCKKNEKTPASSNSDATVEETAPAGKQLRQMKQQIQQLRKQQYLVGKKMLLTKLILLGISIFHGLLHHGVRI